MALVCANNNGMVEERGGGVEEGRGLGWHGTVVPGGEVWVAALRPDRDQFGSCGSCGSGCTTVLHHKHDMIKPFC